MDRTIKFRGKEGDRWVYGDYVHDCYIVEQNNTGMFHVRKDTVGQYTALKDANGVEIYEGDIVTMMRAKSGKRKLKRVLHVVTCNHYAYDWVFKPIEDGYNPFMMVGQTDFDSYKFHVVGNIYDNPEMLNNGEEKKD